MAIGSIEVALDYGGDLVLAPNGDLALTQDTYDVGAATRQRMYRLILTNPTLYDVNNKPIGRPDDLFHPTYGSGLQNAVGQPITDALLYQLQSQIASAIATDPGISQSPAPTVTVVDSGGGFVNVGVSVTTSSGQLVTIPSLPLQILP